MSKSKRSEGDDEIQKEFAQLKSRLDDLLMKLTLARRAFAKSKSDEDKQVMVDVHTEIEACRTALSELGERWIAALGLTSEQVAQIEQSLVPAREPDNRIERSALSAAEVAPTGWIQNHVATGLEALSKIAPKEFLDVDPDRFRLHDLIDGREPLCLVKGLRVESEQPQHHRLQQAVAVARDYLEDNAAFDHFAAGALTPQLGQFGRQFANLHQVSGDVSERIAGLWKHPGERTDAIMFELLVAARCVELGRRVEFIPETAERSPDIRSLDPFPLVIECKRRRPFNDYELAEAQIMRSLFLKLEARASKMGLTGRFDLHLNVEATAISVDDVVEKLVLQRLAARPERRLAYQWGEVAFNELPKYVDLPAPVRIYSASMLQSVFGYASDVNEWDGLICRTADRSEAIIQRASAPIGLAWNNLSARSMTKRASAPSNLFGEASFQVPPGEYGIVYVTYLEGARPAIADRRVQNYMQRMSDWEHSAAVRLPVSFLVRLFPRSLGSGEPDLIENTVMFSSGICDMPELVNDFPKMIVTATTTSG